MQNKAHIYRLTKHIVLLTLGRDSPNNGRSGASL